MSETLSILPISFWLVIVVLVGGGIWAFQRMQDGTGLPMLAVLGTAAVWYVGDAFYNDYANNHAKLFDAATLSGAWWQVAWFLVVFLVATPVLHQRINGSGPPQRSGVLQLFQHGVGFPMIQRQLNLLFRGSVILWSVLFLIAALVLKSQIIYYLFPFLGYKARERGVVRGGSIDGFILSSLWLGHLPSHIKNLVVQGSGWNGNLQRLTGFSSQ